MKPDAIIEVRFRTTAEGGRQTPVVVPKRGNGHYGVPLFADGERFDCRVLLWGETLELGRTYDEVPIKFLVPDSALRKLRVGMPLTLWEGKDVADGKVIRMRRENRQESGHTRAAG